MNLIRACDRHYDSSSTRDWCEVLWNYSDKVTFLSVVCSSLHKTSFAFSASLAAAPCRNTVKEGVFNCFDTLMISFRRGTPRVTFCNKTAKYHFFVIKRNDERRRADQLHLGGYTSIVESIKRHLGGRLSKGLGGKSTNHFSRLCNSLLEASFNLTWINTINNWTWHKNRTRSGPINQSKASMFSLWVEAIFFEQSVDRINMFINKVALYCACKPLTSSRDSDVPDVNVYLNMN